ncbi:unnamed protein product [Trifolium pratense]|uniref:Uncharacterized protein n=1 Tax=Trifolium pratense TaxID=57577 RepID=A0ACB0LHJ2_TRIPR|nr:unnamed protein product [Trifolium pratense]
MGNINSMREQAELLGSFKDDITMSIPAMMEVNDSQNKKGRQGLSTKKTVRSIQDAKDDILDLNKTAEVLETAIPILIGIKFDAFVRLHQDLQWTIVTQ